MWELIKSVVIANGYTFGLICFSVDKQSYVLTSTGDQRILISVSVAW